MMIIMGVIGLVIVGIIASKWREIENTLLKNECWKTLKNKYSKKKCLIFQHVNCLKVAYTTYIPF